MCIFQKLWNSKGENDYSQLKKTNKQNKNKNKKLLKTKEITRLYFVLFLLFSDLHLSRPKFGELKMTITLEPNN